VWRTVLDNVEPCPGLTSFENELIWREFAYSTLCDFPTIPRDDYQSDFAGFPWRDDPEGFQAWAEGRTGFPVVDAAARQLRGEGYVHNRARMIAASFLTKDLLVDWRLGEAWYRHWLTDGDLAQNVAGWQWTAGCGCDPQPYFRIFNPVTQAEKFDPDGVYVRRWVPELRGVPPPLIHAPWTADPSQLRRWGVVLGDTYPHPVVHHADARDRFLAVASAHLKRTPGSVNAPLPLGGM
jgi:deoxyribodipyrimidine photo-lyase